MDISHKSERGISGCDSRAHLIYEMMAERGIEGVQKAWIYSPLLSDGHPDYQITPPVDTHFALYDVDYDENGQLKPSRILDNRPFNVHVAPMITTVEGRHLVFDTYFYQTPPELEQWLDDFEPYEDVNLGGKVTDPNYLHFKDIGSKLPKEGSILQHWEKRKNHAICVFELWHMNSNPVDNPLKAKWVADEFEEDIFYDPDPDYGWADYDKK